MSTISPIVIANVSSVEKTRSALTGLLVENGYLVREGKNGVEALSLAEENPHLIVLDINLDDINGYEVCRRIKSNPSTYFNMVLFVSDGCRESSCRVKGLEVGAVGCLQADSDTSELLATIKSLVRIRKMDEKVRQSSLQWRATFDAINEGVSLLDEYGNVVRCNRAMADLLGLTFIDIIGKPYEHLILNSLGEITLPSFEQLKHTKNREISEFSLNAGWYSASADPVVDDEDNLSGAVYIVTDLTDRKNIELDLINERAKAESSEQQYRLLTQALPQLVWTATRHGQLDYFNQRWFDYTGLSQQESVSGGWQNVVHEDDLQTCLIRWHKALESGDVFEYECRLKRKDGTYRWYLNRAVPLYDNEQRIVKWIGTSTDIEEQKRLQDALRFVAEVSEILSASLDYHATLAGVARLSVPKMADWCLVDVLEEAGSIRRIAIEHSDPESVSRAWKRKGVYSPDPSSSSKLGKVLRTGIPEIIPEITEEILNQVTSEPEYLNELRELHLKSCMVVPLVARGRILGAITFITADSGRYYTSADLALARDLARRAAVFVDNARLYRESQEASRIKDEFLAVVSHELRTPLTAVLGWTKMLLTGMLDEGTSLKALEAIERNAKSQSHIIDDLLDVSRIVRGKILIDTEPVSLKKVVEAAIESVRPAANAKEITVASSLEQEVGLVLGDPNRLQQVVWNLLSNAVKFTPRKGKVTIRIEREDLNAKITVTDSGPGIAPDFLPFIFERFRQADSSTTRTHGGLGLGLAIVRHLVELHGGTVSAENLQGTNGSCFIIRLPIKSTAIARKPELPKKAKEPSRIELAGLDILVVDDEYDTRDLLFTLLESFGANVRIASSTNEALKHIEEKMPDVLVSDIGMPGEDGYVLIKRVRSLRMPSNIAYLPAIALTAYASIEDRMKILDAGFQMHIPKPVDPSELVSAISTVTNIISAR